jgi:Tol biopolymer transport system component
MVALILAPEITFSQSFGRNKPRYRTFDFKVYETPSFEIYHYLDDKTALNTMAQQAEVWYNHIQKFAKDTIDFKNPIVMFNSHGDFQQTNTISSTVGVSTGGVTEAFKNRVTMPFTISNQKTFQVLGHELVHAFQYDVVLRGDSTSLRSLANLPLFMVEGMAEYLTRGRKDPFTAMWMRDIVLNDKIPEIKEMANPKYFPYRYGQTFWAIVTGIHGDEVMAPYFQETAKYGMDYASRKVLGLSLDNLTNEWENALTTYYTGVMGEGAKEQFYGKKILDDKNAGNINISPAISPDGKYLIFLSEKGLFTTDLYLAEVATGKIKRKIASTLRDGDIDNLSAFESAGTWSPDSKKFAYVAFSKGRNKLIIKEVSNAKQIDEYFIDGVDEIVHPAWSPDGRKIIFSGLKQGLANLYLFDLRSEKLTRLTNDAHSEVTPNWSKDGSKVVFASDRLSRLGRDIVGEWTYNISTLDIESGTITDLPLFPGADNMNPNYDENGNIWFLSDRDGYRNIYKYETENDSLFQMTDILTGVCGITSFSPALAVSKRRPRVVFNHYSDGKYLIFSARERSFDRRPVRPDDVDFTAGMLPVIGVQSDNIARDLDNLDDKPAPDIASFEDKQYKSKMQLDFINGSAGVGVGIGSGPYNSGLVNNSGITALFSDMLGDKQIVTSLGLNGEIYDAAGIVQYINRERRLNWGVVVGHVPQRGAVYLGAQRELVNIGGQDIPAIVDQSDLIRQYQDQLGFIVAWPFSTTLRLEGNISTTYQYYRIDRYKDIYTDEQFPRYIASQRERVSIDDVNYANFTLNRAFVHDAGISLVGDNSYFGMTAPLAGHRFRLGVSKYAGGYDFTAFTADGRKYFYLKPVSLAFRALHYARTGNDAESFFPIFVGQQGLVRGYDFSSSNDELIREYNLSFDQLVGSKIFIGNVELRLPFTGPKRLAFIGSNILFSDLNLFLDAGVAFDDYSQINTNLEDPFDINQRAVVFSTGVSLRVNLFGLIVEPYYAKPLREGANAGLGFNLLFGGF